MDASKLKYTESHEWASLEGNIVTVGITDHAQKEISDIVFIELASVGREVKQKESVMVIESVKAAFDIYAPVSGKIIAVNEKLKNKPELVNQSAMGEGWLFKIECADKRQLDSLLTEDRYKTASSGATH